MEELDIQIDSDIPLPDDTRSRNLYPFGKMNVGDSIFICLLYTSPSPRDG